MSTINATAKTAPAAAKVNPAAKGQPQAKPETPATAPTQAKSAATPTPTPARLGKAGIAVLTAISKEPLTRAEISARTGIKSGFCSLLGHVDATKTEPSSLSAKGYLTVGFTEGKSASTYTITDKGREALKAATAPVATSNPATPAKEQPKPEVKPEAKAPATPVKAAAKKAAPKK